MPEQGRAREADLLPPFAALRAFEAVFRLGGLRRAAQALSLDHSVVSRHLRTIEDWLGASIIVRENGRLELTEAGRRFHRRISQAVAELASASAELRGAPPSTRVRFWCVPGFASQWLSGRLARFQQDHRDFSVELRPSDVMPDFGGEGADIDVRYYFDDGVAAPERPGLKVLDLARPAVFPVASPAFLAEHGPPASVAALLSLPLLHEEDVAQWRRWFHENGVRVPEPPGTLCWHAHLALDAARLGRGVALANVLLAARELERGELVEITVPDMVRPRLGRYALVAREARWAQPVCRALRTFLREESQALLLLERVLGDGGTGTARWTPTRP